MEPGRAEGGGSRPRGVVRGPAWICRCYSATILDGEVAEWLNAAVSKTVGQDLPGPGVRIPPSPLQKAKNGLSVLFDSSGKTCGVSANSTVHSAAAPAMRPC